MAALGERTVTLDCDVLQADGGTRTAAITGCYVALADACDGLLAKRLICDFAAARAGGRGVRGHLLAACRCSISITPKIPAPRPT